VKRKRRDDSQNLDSLLDTMANVVGILVVLVAVTQLSVGDAVDRIRAEAEAHQVSRETLEKADLEQEEVAAALADAAERWLAVESGALENAWLLERTDSLLEELEALAGPDEFRGRDAQGLRTSVGRTQTAIARLEKKIKESEGRTARLDRLVKGLPPETRPKIARLPDPRPPPDGSRAIAFFCRYGRIVAVDIDAMQGALREGIREALGEDRMPQPDDWPWLINLFDKQFTGSEGVSWRVRAGEQGTLFADVRWDEKEQGEGRLELELAESAYRRVLSGHSPRNRYARYYVWSDSFEIYLEARYLAEAEGFPVSWMAVSSDLDVGIELTGRGQTRRIMID